VKEEGIGGRVDGVDGTAVRYMAFATFWFQAGKLKSGQAVRLSRVGKGLRPTGETVAAKLVSLKNRGTYGSGVADMVLELAKPADAKTVAGWSADVVVRLIPE
jgi:hypothetical protein